MSPIIHKKTSTRLGKPSLQICCYLWSPIWIPPHGTYTAVISSAVLYTGDWHRSLHSCHSFPPSGTLPRLLIQTSRRMLKETKFSSLTNNLKWSSVVYAKSFSNTKQTHMQKNGFLYLSVIQYFWRLLHYFFLVKMWAFYDKLGETAYFPSVSQRLEKLSLKCDGMPFQEDFPLSGGVCTWIHFQADTFQPDNSSMLCSEIHLSNCWQITGHVYPANLQDYDFCPLLQALKRNRISPKSPSDKHTFSD